MVDNSVVKRWLVAGIILAIFILAFLVLQPLIVAILFGGLFAYVLNPIYRRLQAKIKNKNLSASIILLLFLAVIAIPLFYLTPVIVNQTFDLYTNIQNFNFNELFIKYLPAEIASSLSLNLDNIFGKLFSSFLNNFRDLLVNLPEFLLQFAIFLFALFFIIRDADEIKEYVSTLSPFSTSTENKFMKEFRGITNTIVYGQVLIGIIQGLALGAGLLFLGVPKTLVLTILAVILSIIPFLGPILIWFPVSLFLFATGDSFKAIFLFLYGAIFVSSIDNILRSYLLSKTSNLPVSVSIVGTIGGLLVFGIPGLIIGPLVLAYVIIIIEFYRQGKLNELFRN